MNLSSAQSAQLYMLAQGLSGGGKKQVEMVRQVQPKGMSQHRFYTSFSRLQGVGVGGGVLGAKTLLTRER